MSTVTIERRAVDIAPAALARTQREREFFNSSVNPAGVEDASLLVPTRFAGELERELATLAGEVEGKTVCDYGCGWGLLSCLFAQCGARVYGFDISDSHVAVARRAAQLNRVEGRVFPHVAAAEWLPYPDNFFDFVVGIAVLHHVDLSIAGPEIYRILKPSGTAVFVESLGENPLLEWARRCPLRSSAHRHSKDERSLRYSDIRTLQNLFDQVEVREIRLLRMILWVLQELDINGVTSRQKWLARTLESADDWLLSRFPMLRPFCQYVVVTLHKNGVRTGQPH